MYILQEYVGQHKFFVQLMIKKLQQNKYLSTGGDGTEHMKKFRTQCGGEFVNLDLETIFWTKINEQRAALQDTTVTINKWHNLDVK